MSAIDRYLPFGLSLESLLVLLVGGLTFLSVLSVWYGLVERDRKQARRRMIQNRREELRAASGAATRRRRVGKTATEGMARKIVKSLKLAQTDHAEKLKDQLVRAGKRSREALPIFLFLKVALPIVFGAGAFVWIYVLHLIEMSPTFKPLAVLAATAGGFYAPNVYLSNMAQKRMKAIRLALPDALDLLVICAEAGLSLENSLNRVADELGLSSPALAEELSLTAVELNFLPERRQGLLNLAKRVDVPQVRGVVNTLIQTEKYGTPLSQSLRVLSAEFREERMLKAEEKAARLPATLTVPMIVFILPTLFIVLAGPAIISVYDNLIK